MAKCKQCKAAQHKAYRKTPAGAAVCTRADRKRYYKQYGITLKDYERMFTEQGGRCLLCDASPGKKRLSVDHNHKTGKVRGLLCMGCNVAIGHVDENIEVLENMVSYLKKHEE